MRKQGKGVEDDKEIKDKRKQRDKALHGQAVQITGYGCLSPEAGVSAAVTEELW